MKRRFGRLSLGKRLAVVVALTLAVGVGVVAVASGAPSNPPAPSLTSSVANTTTSTSVSFAFADTQALVTFKCSLDGSSFSTCSSPKIYGVPPLAQGNHSFSVEAVSGSNTSSKTSFSWAIVPPTPTLTVVAPTATPTGSTLATFKFTDTQLNVGFKCSLDGNSFSACSSPKTYSGLGGGSHSFQVEAQVGSNPPSLPASFAWVIDTTPPTITLHFPTNGGAYNNTGWLAGCAPAGICGTASDTAGVSGVAVALRQLSSGKYWNGGSFSSSSIVFNNASRVPPVATAVAWNLGVSPRPVDGQYTVSVRATDGFGNTTASNNYTTATFTIDTIAPAAPKIIDGPSNPSKDKTPEFEFTNPKTAVSFTCKLDSGALTPCTGDTDHDGDNHGELNNHTDTSTFGEIQYGTLTPGPHCFSVFATDPAGNVSPTNQFCWTISGTATNTIAVFSGTPQTATAGGTFALPLKAKVTNASNVGVPGVTVTFTAPGSGASATFAGGVNTAVTDASGIATSVVVSANTTVGGPYNVTATAPSVSGSAVFSLKNIASVSFSVSGGAPLPFYPGLLQRLDLSVTNPNASDLIIPVGGIHISLTTSDQLNCPGLGGVRPNFTVTSNLVQITVPANTTSPLTMSSLGVAAGNRPTVKMNNTIDNQDACKNLSITLDYALSAGGQP